MKITSDADLLTFDFDGREYGVFQDGELLESDVYTAKGAVKAATVCRCGADFDDADLELLVLCEEHREHAAEFCELCNAEEDEEEAGDDEE